VYETSWIDHSGSGTLHETKPPLHSFRQCRYGRNLHLNLRPVCNSNCFADLLDFSYIQKTLQQQDRLLIQSSQREMYLYWPNGAQSDSQNLLMKVQIQDINMEDEFEFLPEPMQLILQRGYKDCLAYTVPNKFWAIAPETLPSLDDLLNSCTDVDDVDNAGPFSRLHKAFGVFAEHYCDSNETQNLPLVSISRTFGEFCR
jgi:hypothetical protein